LVTENALKRKNNDLKDSDNYNSPACKAIELGVPEFIELTIRNH
jgi:hypothetical protein